MLTLAVRVSSEIRAISPKKSPGPRKAIVIEWPGASSTVTSQRPEAMMNIESPWSPWWMTSTPLRTGTGRIWRDSARRMLSDRVKRIATRSRVAKRALSSSEPAPWDWTSLTRFAL